MNEWHFIKDKLPPQPEENENEMFPKEYLCAFKVRDYFEVDTFLYMGNGEFMGENEDYPIYAWYDIPMDIPYPPQD